MSLGRVGVAVFRSSVSVHFTSLSGTWFTEPVFTGPNNFKTRISIQIFLFLCQILRKCDSRDYRKKNLTKCRVPCDCSHRFYEVKFWLSIEMFSFSIVMVQVLRLNFVEQNCKKYPFFSSYYYQLIFAFFSCLVHEKKAQNFKTFPKFL